MSFNFDSNPDDEGIDLDAFDDTGLLALSSRQELISSQVPPKKAEAPTLAGNDIDWEEADSDEGVDWIDVDDHDSVHRDASKVDNDLDRKMSALPAQGVTITFSSTSNTPADAVAGDGLSQTSGDEPKKETDGTRKRKRGTVRILKDVPRHTQQLILGVRRAHLLCCVARSVRYSSICSEVDAYFPKQLDGSNPGDLLLNLAHSLVPTQYHLTQLEADAPKYVIPTDQQLKDFSLWFFDFINAAQRRRNTVQQNIAQGAARRSPKVSRGTCKSAPADMAQIETKKRSNSITTSQCEETLGLTMSNPFGDYLSPENVTVINSLVAKLTYLSPYYDDDPQMFLNDGVDVIGLVERISSLEKVLIFLAMVRYVLNLMFMMWTFMRKI